MGNVPYLYINVIALCCYVLMFLTFLAAKKTQEIKAYIIVMAGFILWTGGSVLMRLQMFPGLDFWYYVSILALFSLAVLIYFFVCSFARVKGYFLKIVWSIGTLILLVVTGFGLILAPPVVDTLANGGIVFRYTMGWPVVIPYLFFFCIVLSIARVLWTMVMEKGIRAPGLLEIIIGCAAVGLGNLAQLIPGNIFPWDTLSGIIFALLLFWALYKKRMFRLTLLVSRSLLTVICVGLCILTASLVVGPLQAFLTQQYGLSNTTATTVIALIFALALSLLYTLIRRMIDALFTREEQQARLLKSFSNAIAQSLDTGDIMSRLSGIIKSEIAVGHVYICLREQEGYAIRFTSETLDDDSYVISYGNPCLKYLTGSENYLILNEFRSDPLYRSMWSEEREFLQQNNIACIAALKDGSDVVGLVLLSGKEKSNRFSYSETSFLETVVSIASIAVKNAGLYEQMYREARIDSLTGVYNYRYFVENINREYDRSGKDSLALIYVDLDDFKLYNQLYGSIEGDKALKTTAEILNLCVGSSGTVFRNSGKVFAILLPGYDGRRSEMLAEEIQRRLEAVNAVPERAHLKRLSASFGICVSPYAASTAKELMENADLAVYNAKNSGKNSIHFFKGSDRVSVRVSVRAMDIVQKALEHNSAYLTNSPTIHALTAAIDAKDHYTFKHSHNVAVYASILATAAGLNDEQIAIIYESGLLHDIGKISIPETILGKNGSLTDDEYHVMKSHVNSAIEMIRYLPSMDYVIPSAVGHHERWDGKGYPRGLKGENIPVTARCLSIADAYDAMTTNRPYRKGLSADYAAKQIEQNAGTQFDPKLAAIFVDLVRSGDMVIPEH